MSNRPAKPKKILIPIDYSLAARSGFNYAEAFGHHLPSQLLALHVHSQSNDTDELHQLKRFIHHYPEQETDYTYEKVVPIIKNGGIEDQILEEIKMQEADLLVMGMRHRHQWWEYLLGSTSSHLLKSSPVPVLLVPEGVTFEAPKKMVLLSDLSMDDEIALAQLLSFADIFDAQVEKLFINPLPSDFNKEQEMVFNTDWTDADPSNCTKVTMVRNRSMQKGIQYFIDQHHPQVLAIYLPVAQQWMGFQQQRLRNLAYSISIPLLILK